MRGRCHEAFSLELSQRLANRHSRHAEVFGERDLIEFRAILEHAGLDRFPECGSEVVGGGAPGLQRRSQFHPSERVGHRNPIYTSRRSGWLYTVYLAAEEGGARWPSRSTWPV